MTTPIDTMHLRTACERTAEMQESFKAADAIGCGLSVAESLMGACADLSTHVPSILALLDEVERLRARPTWERVLRIANGCTDYGGGHHGADHEVYQHGIWTVCNVLKNACERGDKPDMQLRVVEAIGAEAMRAAEPEEGGTP